MKITILQDRLLNLEEANAVYRKGGRRSETDEVLIEPRTGGEFAGKSFYLNSDFEWVLGKDDRDLTVLVPLKKR